MGFHLKYEERDWKIRENKGKQGKTGENNGK
jgi:hypothetical protein